MNNNEYDKHKLYHMAKGSRVLPDSRQEALAYLLSDPATSGNVNELLPNGIDPIELAQLNLDPVFAKRVAYLSDKNSRKKRKPRTLESYKTYSLKKLQQLCESAERDGDKVAAARVLGQLAHEFQSDKPAPAQVITSTTSDALEQLAALQGAKGVN